MRLTTTTLLLALANPAQAEVLCPDSLDVNQQASIAGDWTVLYTDPPAQAASQHQPYRGSFENRHSKKRQTQFWMGY